ncbi:hypothetical protein V8B55DRAFT_1522655 [Mucor lusitanicus]
MSGLKRTFDLQGETSSKRVRFDSKSKSRKNHGETDFEFTMKTINFDVYDSDDEEVGGGVYSSDSDDEDSKKKKDEEEEKVPTAAGEDFDMFGGEPEPSADKGKGKANPNQEIEGQEFNSYDRESEDESDISAFNMKQEMEEGSLDEKGNYIRNKVDPQAFHDKWMEGISRKDMNQAKAAHEKRERDEALKEAERSQACLNHRTTCTRRWWNTSSRGKHCLPGKQKMLDKKNKNKKGKEAAAAAAPAQLTEQEEESRRKTVEAITGLADQMMALGHFNIYEDTFEIMVRHLRKEDWMPASFQ